MIKVKERGGDEWATTKKQGGKEYGKREEGRGKREEGRRKREEGRAGLLKLGLTIVKIEGGEGLRMRGMGNVKTGKKRQGY